MSSVIKSYKFEADETEIFNPFTFKRQTIKLTVGKLHITFTNGQTYTYHKVPRHVVEALDSAPSKGHYFYHNIRSSFAHSH